MAKEFELFKEQYGEKLDLLMRHFQTKGMPYKTVDRLMVDMLDDVIDVWLDAHLGGNDDCEEV